jgi:hypothetical protein
MGNYGLEKLSWALIYGGLVVLCIGIFMRPAAPAAARVLVAAGAAIAAVGALLIWVRSRRKN